MPISRKTAAGIAALGIALVGGPVAIAAQHQDDDRGVLALTVTGRDGDLKVSTLRCGPAGGSHPAATSACAQIDRVDGDLSQLDARPQTVCTLEYDPVTATARGTWEGKIVNYHETFPNRCAMYSYTGSVFTI